MNPGDIIYYPEGNCDFVSAFTSVDYWHQTKNIDQYSISLSSSVVTASNHKHLRNELQSECNGSRRVFTRDDVICERLEICNDEWRREFSSDL